MLVYTTTFALTHIQKVSSEQRKQFLVAKISGF